MLPQMHILKRIPDKYKRKTRYVPRSRRELPTGTVISNKDMDKEVTSC